MTIGTHGSIFCSILYLKGMTKISTFFVNITQSKTYTSVPRILCLDLPALVAHLVLNDILHDETLLKDGPGHHLGLDGHLDLDPLGVRLRPHEVGVDQANLGQVLEPLEAERHQLTRL